MPCVNSIWNAPAATGCSCSKGGTVSGPLSTNLMLPLLAASTFLAKPSASSGTAGLVLSQLVSIRYSAAAAGAVETARASKAPVHQRIFIAFLPLARFAPERSPDAR